MYLNSDEWLGDQIADYLCKYEEDPEEDYE